MPTDFSPFKTICLSWLSLLLIVFPSSLKIPIYRWLYGYRIGKHVKIGFAWLNVGKLNIGDNVVIGHFTRIKNIPEVEIGEYTNIGVGNTFTATPEFTNPRSLAQRGNCPKLIIGRHCGIATLHYFDVQDTFTIGEYTTIAGVYSVFFTHFIDVVSNRQSVRPIHIGNYCLIGASVRFSPGASIPDCCVVGMGAVVTKAIQDSYTLIAGVPASVTSKLPEDALYFHRDRGVVLSFTAPMYDAGKGS